MICVICVLMRLICVFVRFICVLVCFIYVIIDFVSFPWPLVLPQAPFVFRQKRRSWIFEHTISLLWPPVLPQALFFSGTKDAPGFCWAYYKLLVASSSAAGVKKQNRQNKHSWTKWRHSFTKSHFLTTTYQLYEAFLKDHGVCIHIYTHLSGRLARRNPPTTTGPTLNRQNPYS